MGAGQSVPTKINRQTVYDLTKSTRDMMNVILDYMLKEISIRDFYLLSNPNECKKYVLFLTNTLYKQFYELGIEMGKDKQGALFFRPIKELVEVPESEKVERQSLCLILAYFYTRIFQIFGALALTLIDDASIMTSSGLLIDTTVSKQRLLAPGARPYVTMGGDNNMIGGATINLGIYNFMRNYLNLTNPNDTYGYNIISPGNDIYFKIQPKTIGVSSTPAIFTIFTRGARRYFNLDITVKPDSTSITYNKVLVTLQYIRYNKKGETADSKKSRISFPSELGSSTVRFVLDEDTIPYKKYPDYKVSGTDITVNDYFQDLFSKLIPYVRNLSDGTIDYTGYSDYSRETGEYGRKTYSVSDKEVIDELRLERTLHNLVRQKPLGHCIARALQLLNSIGVKGDKWESNICKANFLIIKDGSIRTGLPKPGESLDTSPGLAALSQLFYDTVRYGLPKITMSEPSVAEYSDFMKRMAIMFGDYKTTDGVRSSSDLIQKGLKGIKDNRDGELCRKRGKMDTFIIVPNNKVETIQEYVTQLYKTQLEHSKKAGAIIKLLFNIERDKTSGRYRISFNDNILKKGIPEINRINSIARKVLIEYYETCESTYIKGMNEVLNIAPRKPTIGVLPTGTGTTTATTGTATTT